MSDKKRKNPTFVIMRRELRAYFTSPVAYIVSALFLIVCGVWFFMLNAFYLQNRAELRGFFGSLPLILSFFVPALTMRLFSEERRVGSIETLMTLPVTEVNVVLGKYFASLIGTLVMIAPTVFFAVTCEIFGSPDYGPIAGGYLGAIFLAASFTAIGLFASSVTKNQILAFFTGCIICVVLTLLNSMLIFLPAAIVDLLSFLSISQHFSLISRGVIDTRDILYFISLTALFIVFTIKVQQNSKR